MSNKQVVKHSFLYLLSLCISNILSLLILFLVQETSLHDDLFLAVPIIFTIVVPLCVGYLAKSKFSPKSLIFLFVIMLAMIGIAVLHYRYDYPYLSELIDVFNSNQAFMYNYISSNFYENDMIEKLLYVVVALGYPLIVFGQYYLGGLIKSRNEDTYQTK